MAAYLGRHRGVYDPRVDVVRTTYKGRHATPEKVVSIAEQRAIRRRRNRKDAL